MKTEEIFQILKDQFGDSIIELNTSLIEPFILVDPMKIDEIAFFLRDEQQLQFDNLMCLSGVDDANGAKSNDAEGALQIVGGTLSVYYHIESTILKHKTVLKVAAPRENPDVKSVEEIWKSADWHEREAFDLIGIVFLNHSDLRRILCPDDWEGHSLRKDYKVPEFYSGMKVPY